MRIWHTDLLPYLPDLQFKGQLRELVAIMRDWRDKGKTNHLLINKVMDFDINPKLRLVSYFALYNKEYVRRYGYGVSHKIVIEFYGFEPLFYDFQYEKPYCDWHNYEYLRCNMANLLEKHFFGIGKSRITDEGWERLCDGYKKITGEEYKI